MESTYTLQGMPENRFEHNLAKLRAFAREEVGSDGSTNTDSRFGRLNARVGEASDTAFTAPYTVLAEGNDLRSQWERMRNFRDHVNSVGYEYRPYHQNSNSFAAGALRHAGVASCRVAARARTQPCRPIQINPRHGASVRPAFSPASLCLTIPCRRSSLACRIDPQHPETTWTIGLPVGSSRSSNDESVRAIAQPSN